MHPLDTLRANISAFPHIHTLETLTAKQVRHLRQPHNGVRIQPGTYLPIPRDPTQHDTQRTIELAQIAASIARGNPEDTISHHSAALLWGFPHFGETHSVHILRPLGGNYRRARHKVRTAKLLDHEIHNEGPVRLTSFVRTTLDFAAALPAHKGLAVIDHARAHGIQLAELLEAPTSYAGGIPARLRTLIEMSVANAESPQESITRYWLHQAGLTTVQTQVKVHNGTQNYYLDCAVPEIKLAAEYDGRGKYTSPQSLYDEKLREDAIRAQGWTFIRLTAKDMKDPVALMARFRHVARGLGWRG